MIKVGGKSRREVVWLDNSSTRALTSGTAVCADARANSDSWIASKAETAESVFDTGSG